MLFIINTAVYVGVVGVVRVFGLSGSARDGNFRVKISHKSVTHNCNCDRYAMIIPIETEHFLM